MKRMAHSRPIVRIWNVSKWWSCKGVKQNPVEVMHRDEVHLSAIRSMFKYGRDPLYLEDEVFELARSFSATLKVIQCVFLQFVYIVISLP